MLPYMAYMDPMGFDSLPFGCVRMFSFTFIFVVETVFAVAGSERWACRVTVRGLAVELLHRCFTSNGACGRRGILLTAHPWGEVLGGSCLLFLCDVRLGAACTKRQLCYKIPEKFGQLWG